MLHPVIDQVAVDTQNEVVKEEKRQSYDRPYGKLLKVIWESLFKVHPYKDENIGRMEDLDAATLEEFMAYFDKYYSPDNAVLVVAGDIEIEKTKSLVSKYFSEVKKRPGFTRNFPKEVPITYYLLYDNVNLINEQIDIYRSISREEIQSVAQKYLSPNQRVEIEYLPGEEIGEE